MKNSANKQLTILSVTSKSLKEGALRGILPEYYDLSSAVENNPWHKNQNVFDHVVSVFEGLEKIFKFDFLSLEEATKIKNYLQAKIGKYSRKEILIIATILHDIAKSETLVRNKKTGLTKCPGHEVVGSYLAQEMGKRFGLTAKNLSRLIDIIYFHGFIHDMLGLAIEKGPPQRYLSLFQDVTKNFSIEVSLLAYADMLGSDLPSFNSQEFTQRERLLKEILRISLREFDA